MTEKDPGTRYWAEELCGAAIHSGGACACERIMRAFRSGRSFSRESNAGALVSTWHRAVVRKGRARAEVLLAEQAVARAREDLAENLLPTDYVRGTTYCLSVGDGFLTVRREPDDPGDHGGGFGAAAGALTVEWLGGDPPTGMTDEDS